MVHRSNRPPAPAIIFVGLVNSLSALMVYNRVLAMVRSSKISCNRILQWVDRSCGYKLQQQNRQPKSPKQLVISDEGPSLVSKFSWRSKLRTQYLQSLVRVMRLQSPHL
ncbi:hypothetical protein BCR33DRAFT_181912 [Rhizoclosmatium globosum]|uniref:Uncharacterized protein n=1 Tax=Rhizoclosmatium globosum TaxID=329046 RepID=A0A1Y2D1C5_9FUNG|nr:hypothetical protein BCR33DRAFT_181912 [Rhizoclosmatium globosum]|eukprot:ORY52936.1 hypothetical protein BCR33DRAFT_181912 [Rhizoclosmatium globosum]